MLSRYSVLGGVGTKHISLLRARLLYPAYAWVVCQNAPLVTRVRQYHGGRRPWLSIGALIPHENRRNLDEAFGMVRHKNDAVPAYTFPIPASPPSPLERDHIPAKRVSFKIVNRPPHTLLDITRLCNQLG